MSQGTIINDSVLRALNEMGRGAVRGVVLFDDAGRERERITLPGEQLPAQLALDLQSRVVRGLDGTAWRARVDAFELYGKTSHYVALFEQGEARASVAMLSSATGLVARLTEFEYELSELSKELAHRYEEISFLHKLHEDFATSMGSLRKLCQRLLDRVLEALPSRSGAVLLTSGRGGRATIRAAHGMAKMSGEFFFSDRTIFDEVQRMHQSRVLDDSRQVPAHVLGPLAQNGFRSLLVVPLHWKKHTLGLLLLMDREQTTETVFSSNDVHLAETIATQFAAILHNRRLAEYRMELRKEIEIARRLQTSLMQQPPVKIPGLDIGSVMQRGSKSVIGGDYFDWHEMPDPGRLRAVIVDVSGHDIASTLMMVLARAIIKSEARSQSSPREIMRRMNEDLYPEFSKSELFLTGFLLDVDGKTGSLRYANAGHPPPLLLRRDEPLERHEGLSAEGLPVGILPAYAFEEKDKILNPGDVLVLYTDGVTEARSAKKKFFGEKRLAKAAHEAVGGTAQEIAKAIDAAVQRYRDPDPEADQDDRAVVVIKKT